MLLSRILLNEQVLDYKNTRVDGGSPSQCKQGNVNVISDIFCYKIMVKVLASGDVVADDDPRASGGQSTSRNVDSNRTRQVIRALGTLAY